MGQGLIIRNPTPQWLTDPSVTDSAMTKALRMIGQLIGADDPTSQVLGIMSTLVPSAGKAGGAVAKVIEKVKGIKAYQGSPHDFPAERLVRYQDGRTEYLVGRPDVLPDVPHGAEVMKDFPLGRQRSDKIGTGEGAQAYGHGLYFADKQSTAASYKQAGVHDPRDAMSLVMNELKAHPGNDLELADTARHALSQRQELAALAQDDDAIRHVVTVVRGQEPGGTVSNAAIQSYRALDNRMDALPKGRMYEVNIKADPDAFLDWDKPMDADQLERFGAKLDSVDPDMRRTVDRLGESMRRHGIQGPSGQEIVEQFGGVTGANARNLTSTLREAGIPGIKYLDQGSRAAGEGSRNYVVFDDSIIDILKKYGLLPAAVGTGAVMSQEQTR